MMLFYRNGQAHAEISGRKLSSQHKPLFSFAYDELDYSANQKMFVLNSVTYILSDNQCREIEIFLNSLEQSEDEATRQRLILSCKEYLNSTDWMVIRELETGVKMSEFIKNKRAFTRQKITQLEALA